MVKYAEALELARKHFPTVDNYTEYDIAYVFGDSTVLSIGGSGQPIVIMKETGEVQDFVSFIGDYPGCKEIASGPVE